MQQPMRVLGADVDVYEGVGKESGNTGLALVRWCGMRVVMQASR